MDDAYMTSIDAAELLDESLAEVYARITAGTLPAWRIDGEKGPAVGLRRLDVAAAVGHYPAS